MKIYLIAITLIAAAIVFTACAAKGPTAEAPPPTEALPPSAPAADEPPASEPPPVTVENPEFNIIGDIGWIYSDDISGLPLISGEDIPASLPVYVNKYPAGQGGALFTIDQPLINGLRENLGEFLRILYEEGEVKEYIIQQKDAPGIAMVYFDTGATKINAKPGGISMITNEYDLDSDLLNGNLLENKLFQAATEYLNIDIPLVSSITKYKESGDIYEYITTVTETTDDFLENTLNNNFSFAKATYGPGSSGVLLEIWKIGTPELHSDEMILPYQEAQAYVQQLYGFVDSTHIYAELYYSTTIETGYFIPCYVFYIDTGETDLAGNSIKYDIVRIPAVSFPGDSPE